MLSLALTATLAVLAVVAIGVGAADLDVGTVVEVIARRLRLIAGEGVTELDDRIVWELRMPRVLGALAVGASLAICGVILQSLTRNALAEPYLLGISGGASMGAVAAIVFGVSLPFVPANLTIAGMAFAGAFTALVVVLILATGRSGALPPVRTVVAGVAIGQLASAFTSLAILVFGERDAARTVLAWTFGSIAGMRWPSAFIVVGAATVALVALVFATHTLDAFAFGETSAAALGVNVNGARWALLVATALITATTVAFVGQIGFVGLIVPHLIRLATGPSHYTLLPLSALAGGVLLLGADTIARTLREGTEIPVGVVTAVIGVPVLVGLLRQQAAHS